MRRGMRHVDTHRRALEIMREEYQRLEREFRAQAPHCERKGHPDRAAAWLRGADWCRAQWKATLQ